MPKCKGKTKAGQRCKRNAVKGGRCAAHGGATGKAASRPTKLNAATRDAIVEYVTAGMPKGIAAEAAGIGKSTFFDWIKRGEAEPDSDFSDFSDAIKKAYAEAAVRNLAIIQLAAKTNWQAAAWYLERTRPDEFGRRTRSDVTLGARDGEADDLDIRVTIGGGGSKTD